MRTRAIAKVDRSDQVRLVAAADRCVFLSPVAGREVTSASHPDTGWLPLLPRRRPQEYRTLHRSKRNQRVQLTKNGVATHADPCPAAAPRQDPFCFVVLSSIAHKDLIMSAFNL